MNREHGTGQATHLTRTMLQIDNLRATVAGKPILKDLSLTANAGEIHAIMGPSHAIVAHSPCQGWRP